MLIVFSGLPGTGKTSIARELAARLPCAYLRIDAIEQAMANADPQRAVGAAGYAVAYALARSNLALGTSVIADCVNPLVVTREAWRAVAAHSASDVLEVEIVCSDAIEHRRRVEAREVDIQDLTPPTWEAVLRHEYEAWTTERLVIDSARLSVSGAAQRILAKVRNQAAGERPSQPSSGTST